MKQYMLLFSLGPVQSFIAQARKTRDLWLGSFLLSTLMEAGMEGLKGEFIYPTKQRIKGIIPDLPNKYIVIFNDLKDAQSAVNDSIEQIYKRWNTIRHGVWNEIVDPFATSETDAIWKRQSNPEAFFEIFWVI